MEKLKFNFVKKITLLLGIICLCVLSAANASVNEENKQTSRKPLPIAKHNVKNSKNISKNLDNTSNVIDYNYDVRKEMTNQINQKLATYKDDIKDTFSKKQLKKSYSALIAVGVVVALIGLSYGAKCACSKFNKKKRASPKAPENSC